MANQMIKNMLTHWRSIAPNLKKLIAKGEITVIDIDPAGLRLIQLKKTPDGIKLTRIIKSNSPVSLKELLQKNNIKISKLIAFIPRHLVTVKYITLPAKSPSEVEDMLKYEIDGLLPYPLEELIYDYCVLDTDEKGYSKVMVFLAQKQIIEGHISTFREQGLEPDVLQVSTVALFNWLLVSQKKDEDKLRVVLNLGNSSFDLAIGKGKKILFSRGVKTEEDTNSILSEIKRSLAIYRKEANGEEISKVILTGINGRLDSLKEGLEKLSLKAERAELLDNIITDSVTDKLKDITPEASSFIKLIGAGLGGYVSDTISINLIPESIRIKKLIIAKKKELIQKASLLATAVVLILAVFSYKIHRREVYIQKASLQIAKIAPLALEIEGKRKRLDAIRDHLSQESSCSDILAELFQITPEQIALNMFLMEEGKSLIIRGQAQELSQAFDYITLLQKSPYLDKVKVRYANKRTVAEKELVDFELSCDLSSFAGRNISR